MSERQTPWPLAKTNRRGGGAASEHCVGAVLMLEHKSPRRIKVGGGEREQKTQALEINGCTFSSENEAFMCGKPR